MISRVLLTLFLMICSVTDLVKKQIYLKIIFPFMAAGLALFFINGELSLLEELGGIFLGVILLLLARVSSEKIGYGDGLMVIVSGIFLGLFMNIRLLMWALFISALVSAVLLMIKKAGRHTELPFAPFLLISYALMTVFYNG